MSAAIAIVGAGPVGLTLALLLARRSVPSIVVDARPLDAALRDPRLLALSQGSLQTLRNIAEWPASAMAPIQRIVISSAGEFGRAVLDAADANGAAFGATIRYSQLLRPLAAAADAAPLIEVRRPFAAAGIRQTPQHAELHGENSSVIVAPLVVHAEGSPPGGRAEQHAVIADVRVSGIAPGTAHERFTRDGPLALLPLTDRGSMAMVWCMSGAEAARRVALDEPAFVDELNRQLGRRIAHVLSCGPRAEVPLVERIRSPLREHRQVYIGNAAQAMHPVAGQGLNVGLRDCAVLADALAQAAARGADLLQALPDYQRSRQLDRQSIIAITRVAPELFASSFAPLAWGRSLALTAMAALPPLRRQFAQLMMFGVRG